MKTKDQTTIVYVENGKITLLVRTPPAVSRHSMANFMLKTGGMSVASAMTAGLPNSGAHENLFLMQFELPKRTKKVFTEGDGLVMRVIGSIINERIQKYIVLSSSNVSANAVQDTIHMLLRLLSLDTLKDLCVGVEKELMKYMPFE
jgi:hypothetical protein